MKNKKEYVYIILYYVLLIMICILLSFYSFTNGVIICLPSHFLYIILVFVIPVILLIVPVMMEKFMKISVMRTVKISMMLSLIYFGLIIPLVHFGIILYSKTFTIGKWNNMRFLRYLMVDDLESKYNLVGMDRDELINLLGNSDRDDDNLLCYFVKDDIDDYYYCLKIDNGLVIDSYKNY